MNHFAAEDILLNNIRLERKMKWFFADIYDAKAQWKYWMMVYSQFQLKIYGSTVIMKYSTPFD